MDLPPISSHSEFSGGTITDLSFSTNAVTVVPEPAPGVLTGVLFAILVARWLAAKRTEAKPSETPVA